MFGDSWIDVDSEDTDPGSYTEDEDTSAMFTKNMTYYFLSPGCSSKAVPDSYAVDRIPFLIMAVNGTDNVDKRPAVFIDVNFCSSCFTQHRHWLRKVDQVNSINVHRPRYSLAEHDWGPDLLAVFPEFLRPLTLIDKTVIAPLYPFRNVVLLTNGDLAPLTIL